MAAIEVGFGEIGFKGDGLGVIRQRAIQIALGLLHIAAIEVGIGVVRFYGDCLVEIRQRGIQITLGFPGLAAIAVGENVAGFDLNGFGVVRNSAA